MATDYDAPRHKADDDPGDALPLPAAKPSHADPLDDLDPFDLELEAPRDVDGDDLTVTVLPKQADEFTCTSCYLVWHRSQRATTAAVLCRDCA